MNIHSLAGNSPTFYKNGTLTVARLRGKNKNKNKNETATAPSRFFKKKEKNRTSRRRLNTNGTTPLQVIPSLRIRQGALVFFLFTFV